MTTRIFIEGIFVYLRVCNVALESKSASVRAENISFKLTLFASNNNGIGSSLASTTLLLTSSCHLLTASNVAGRERSNTATVVNIALKIGSTPTNNTRNSIFVINTRHCAKSAIKNVRIRDDLADPNRIIKKSAIYAPFMACNVPQLQRDLCIVVPVQRFDRKVHTDRQFVIGCEIALTIALY